MKDNPNGQPQSAPAALYPMLAVSGACALAYQVVWFRAFRLTFGSSTVAQALVVAAFLIGLGGGTRWFGPRIDLRSDPIRVFAAIELAVGLAAGASLPLLYLLDTFYVGIGGSSRLGPGTVDLLRFLMALVTVGPPAFFMGGSLPAMLRALESETDGTRHRTGLAIGTNTLGAVAGALLTSFYLLEHWGLRAVLLASAAVNLILAAGAYGLGRGFHLSGAIAGRSNRIADGERHSGVEPAWAVLAAAFLSGFVFFLMELVWARVMSPLLGGSTYTFALILATALAGLAVGGLLYSLRRSRRPRWSELALVSGVEALALSLPLVLGDRVAIWTLLLRSSADGFLELVLGWCLISAVVVLPTALAAGYQFPLLIAMLRPGRQSIGADLGSVTLWNTLGSVLGCVAGAYFGWFPRFGAMGLWRASVVALTVIGAGSIAWSLVKSRGRGAESREATSRVAAAVCVACSLASLGVAGPSAAWRHSPIGAGRLVIADEPGAEVDDLRAKIHDDFQYRRRSVIWETDGVESSLALAHRGSYSFLINGKADGSALSDAPTQIMATLLGAVLHPKPHAGLVIGFGTGSSVGWLARVDEVERVDVVELEPAVLDIAAAFDPVSAAPLQNSKVRVHLGDAREYLRTTDRSWDLIFSEPSNPYRAGIGSLFTTEFYGAAKERLNAGGLFLQWVQAYEIDRLTVRTVLATLNEVFAHVEVWQTATGDLLLVAGEAAPEIRTEDLRRKIASEPWADALRKTWWTEDLEGLMARFVMGPRAVDHLALGAPLNSDDRLLIEYSFARTVGARGDVASDSWLREVAAEVGDEHPRLRGPLDWTKTARRLATLYAVDESRKELASLSETSSDPLYEALEASLDGELARVAELWPADRSPEGPYERFVLAEAVADRGDSTADEVVASDAEFWPTEVAAVRSRRLLRSGDLNGAVRALEESFRQAQNSPWMHFYVRQRSLYLAVEIARQSPEAGRSLFDALEPSWAVGALEEGRLATRVVLAGVLDRGSCGSLIVAALEAYEPYPPWQERFLDRRATCYGKAGHALAGRAAADLRRFRRHQGPAAVRAARRSQDSRDSSPPDLNRR